MRRLLTISTANLIRAGALLCALCFMFMLGCAQHTSCEIVVSGPGSLCNIRYTDNEGVFHVVLIQSDSNTIVIDDCDEVESVNCS